MMRTIMSAEGPKQMIINDALEQRGDEDIVVNYCWEGIGSREDKL